jgi:hypothetical protein
MASRIQRKRKTFCTECGVELDDFWQSPKSMSYEGVLKRHLQCQREGRFKGSMCSKLFIVDGGTPDSEKATPPLSPRKRTALKNAILKKIKSEGNKS